MQPADDVFGEVVQAQRCRADGVPHLRQPRKNPIDLRVIAQRDGDQAGVARVDPRFSRARENSLGRKRPDGKIVVPGPAEPAQVGASADHLDEEPGPEFGVRRKDLRARRLNRPRRRQRGLPDHGRRAGSIAGHEPLDGAVGAVLHVVEARDVEAALRGQKSQKILPRSAKPKPVDELRHELFAFAGGDDIGEHRERFGIDERDGAAYHDEWIPLRAIGRANRYTSQTQHRQNIRVIPFEGDGERDHVKIAHQRLRFERDQRHLRCELLFQLLLWRKKNPLAHNVVLRVEQLIDGLKTQVRHSHVVRVWKGQGHTEAIGVRLAHVSHFLREGGQGLLALFPGIHEC